MPQNASRQLTKGFASFPFSVWGYARRKRLGTSVLEDYVSPIRSFDK